MNLETRHLNIRHFTAADAPALTRALSDPRIFTHLPESVPELADIKGLIDGFVARDNRNRAGGFTGTNFALVLKSNQSIIGWCGIQPFDPYPDQMEIFYGLAPAYWRHGYATEAARAVLQYGFDTLGLAEVVAGVKPDNLPSIRVLEKLGFTFKGTIDQVPPGAEWYLGERYYAVSREGFQSVRPAC